MSEVSENTHYQDGVVESAGLESGVANMGNALPAGVAGAFESHHLRFGFYGSAGEYFKIWIVNLFFRYHIIFLFSMG